MIWLVLGVALWAAAHMFKRIAPDARKNMGEKGKGVVALALAASVVLMVLGYRAAPVVDLWYPPAWTLHLNNLLVLVAIFLMSPAPRKGKIFNKMRHPQLAGFRAWAFAHLLVNGDLASVILFGGLFIWAAAEVVMINKAEGDWQPTQTGTYAKDAMFLVASLILMAIIGYIHGWLGPWPFPGAM
ncbi:NnrU family protein [Shimia biformata]|uniref:NnrU family protein n=1 Tax=Shimia biformata TaxID=1294299 RepID=UPI00195096E4|nr:NnrU family protein [Shimia biformata]